MKHISVLLVLVAVSFASGYSIQDPRDEGSLKFLKEIIKYGNNFISTKGYAEYKIPDLSYDLSYAKVYTRNGQIGNFASINLIGNDQIFNTDTKDGNVIVDFDLKIGLDSLKLGLKYEASVLYLLGTSGDVEISTTHDAIRMKGYLKANNESCSTQINNVQVSSLDQFQVSITPSGLINSSLRLVVQTAINYGLSLGQNYINSFIDEFLTSSTMQKQISDVVCSQIKKVSFF